MNVVETIQYVHAFTVVPWESLSHGKAMLADEVVGKRYNAVVDAD